MSARAMGSTGILPPRLTEEQKIDASAARSAVQSLRYQRQRDADLLALLELEDHGVKSVAPGGSLPLVRFRALAARGFVEPVWRLTPAGRRRAAQLRRAWNA